MLEANPKLSWRDLQHLVVNTSRMTNRQDKDWQKNGAGHHVNHKYGFGVLDTAALVTAATSPKWRTVSKQHMCQGQDHTDSKKIPANGTLTSSIISAGCSGKTNCVSKLEHVRVYVTLSHQSRGSLRIVLTSPAGTRSELLSPRPRDYSRDGFSNWAFMTVFSWGENPAGIWKIEVSDTKGFEGEFKQWSIRLYGTCEDSFNHGINLNDVKTCSQKCKKGCEYPFNESCPNCTLFCHCDLGQCLPLCHADDYVFQERKECRKNPITQTSNGGDDGDDDDDDGEEEKPGYYTVALPTVAFVLVAVILATAAWKHASP